MHAGHHYSLKEIIVWTRRETAVFLLLTALPTTLYITLHWHWLALPWLPIAMIGTAVAFLTGFKNNASYSRLWEARQIYGAILNTSRSWAILVLDAVPDPIARRRLFHRHFAYLTALRYQLREPRAWENSKRSQNVEYQAHYHVAEWDRPLPAELTPHLDPPELAYVLARKNRPTHLLHLQAQDLRASVPLSPTSEFRLLELQRLLASFTDSQGKCERIKNFPYPRQFASLNHLFIWLFIILAPLGLLQEFHKLGESFVWVNIPASTLIAWVFHTMDKIGEATENPFEGGPNDVPITALSRTIEIDLLEMLGETSLPPALQPENNILM